MSSSQLCSPIPRSKGSGLGFWALILSQLMAAYLNATNSPQGTLTILSLGIRMAQDAGAHRKKLYTTTPTVEQELWKRAFWYVVVFVYLDAWRAQGGLHRALVSMDRLASFGMGRQCSIHDEE